MNLNLKKVSSLTTHLIDTYSYLKIGLHCENKSKRFHDNFEQQQKIKQLNFYKKRRSFLFVKIIPARPSSKSTDN